MTTPCPHPDWRIGWSSVDDAPVVATIELHGKPASVHALQPVCTECGEPVQVGAAVAMTDDIEAIRQRYADGFGDMEQAAEDVATLLAILDAGLPMTEPIGTRSPRTAEENHDDRYLS